MARIGGLITVKDDPNIGPINMDSGELGGKDLSVIAELELKKQHPEVFERKKL